MRSRTRLYAIPLLFSLAVMVACGDDDDNGTGPGDTGDELTQQESVEMLEALAAVGSFNAGFFGGFGFSVQGEEFPAFSINVSDALSTATVPVEESFDETTPCPEGGSLRQNGNVTGNIDDQTGAADLNLTMVQTHMDCVGTSDSGRTFTFNGAPNITTDMNLSFTADGSSFQLDGTQDGTLAWETDGKSGTCGFDVTFDFSGSESSFQGSVSGTVCGHSVNETIDESL